jgi:hypothetical protein
MSVVGCDVAEHPHPAAFRTAGTPPAAIDTATPSCSRRSTLVICDCGPPICDGACGDARELTDVHRVGLADAGSDVGGPPSLSSEPTETLLPRWQPSRSPARLRSGPGIGTERSGQRARGIRAVTEGRRRHCWQHPRPTTPFSAYAVSKK